MSFKMFHKPLVTLMLSISLIVVQAEIEVPLKCGSYELFARCIQSNPPTCRIPRYTGAWKCDGYCICQKSFVRDDEGKCIPIGECPPPCPEASVFEQCSNNYKQLCLQTEGRRVDSACTPGCSCIPGYCWEVRSKSCIKISENTGRRYVMKVLRFG